MEALRVKEVKLQRWARTELPFLEPFAVLIHFAVREVGLLLLLAIALFSGSQWRWATSTFAVLAVGELINGALKFITTEPRPLWREEHILSASEAADLRSKRSPSPQSQSPSPSLPTSPRPKKPTWEPDYSFPSSHSQVVMSIAVSVGRYLGWRHPVSVFGFVLAVSAGLSRAYLGFHYLHDVVCGLVLGAGIAFVILPFTDAIPSLPLSVTIAFAFFWLCFPFVLRLITLIVPDPSDTQIRKWEEHARKKSGCNTGHIKTRSVSMYVVQACNAFVSFAALAIIPAMNWDSFFCSSCPSLPAWKRLLVFALRMGLGIPALLFTASTQGNVSVMKGAAILVATAWGNSGTYYFVEKALGVHCQ